MSRAQAIFTEASHRILDFIFISYIVWLCIHILRVLFPILPLSRYLSFFLFSLVVRFQHCRCKFVHFVWNILHIICSPTSNAYTNTHNAAFCFEFTFRNVSHHEIVHLFALSRLHSSISLSSSRSISLTPSISLYLCHIFFVYREKSEFSAYEIRFPIEFHVHIMNTQHYASVVCRRLIRKKSPKTISFIATRWKNTINIFHLKL